MEFVLDNKLSFVYTDLLDWQLSLAENRRGWRSLLSIISLSLGDLTRDAWVVRDVTGLRFVESVACCSHELSLVRRAEKGKISLVLIESFIEAMKKQEKAGCGSGLLTCGRQSRSERSSCRAS